MISKTNKIAVVVPKYGHVGGGERFVFELTERLAHIPSYEVHVFSNKWIAKSELISFHKVPKLSFPKWLTSISFAYFANRKIAKMDFDLIHSHDRIFKSNIATLHSIPHRTWIREVREKKWSSLYDYGTSWTEKQLFNCESCRMFLPVSHLVKEKTLEVFPLEKKKFQVIHPGVDVKRFKSADPLSRNKVRQEFGISEKELLILFVGMNFEVKGLNTLLSAVSLLKSEYNIHQIKILVVGKGNKKKYKTLAHRLGIGEQLIFANVRKDMERIYPAGDVLALLSKFDTFGMVVTEAMASSLPVIISKNVGAKDLVIQGENGFVVDRKDIGMISSKIALMMNRGNRLGMGEKARATAMDNTWEKMAQKVVGVYESFLSYP